ncbi:uncharacterized protein LOC129608134 [Condylostylus longicornis]|uniref:uncharacterized protein LOC129608134 n=1 Tax=Condylostylus longicornis TaxID=2530218 RepID=UPI00244E517A|nr:uncharacterized protein LOC129608134 [Condylostylus longicornis]
MTLVNGTYILPEKNVTNSLVDKRSTASAISWTDPYDDNKLFISDAWTSLLEDYALSKTNRMSRMEGQYQQHFIPSSNFYITRRVDESENDAINNNKRPPRIGNFPNLLGNGGPPNTPLPPPPPIQSNTGNLNRQFFQSVNNKPLREVSETDLYLLGAMEKLVYRMDYLESRVRRSEQLIYYLMAGNNQNKREDIVPDPCPKNFTKVGDNCYHLSEQQLNWKSANSICKSMSSHLAEFESISENEDIVAYVLNHPHHRGKDFWLGGLNPGLLWIWSNSAKPVNPNTNLTSIASTYQNSTNDFNNKGETTKDINNKILNNIMEIRGNGRCLRLSYNPPKHTYFYYGQECTSRQNFICEFEDKTIENQIKKVGRQLNLF